ncbi:MAG: tyrosine-protein phosphatase [Thermoanaerobaculia bacterium]
MIDIHSHILPAIDDGAGSHDVAVEMCWRAARDGCTTLVATPHQRTSTWWNCEPSELNGRFEDLRSAVGDQIDLRLGAEIRIDGRLLEAVADLEASGVLPLAGSRYLLLEFDRRGMGGLDPKALTHELRLQGWRPVFAHPEFIPELASDPALMHRLIEHGGRFQLTAMSLTGGFGRRKRALAEGMVRDGLVHFVASDAHDLSHRPPGLRQAHRQLTQTFGESVANRLILENPLAILEDRPVEASAC